MSPQGIVDRILAPLGGNRERLYAEGSMFHRLQEQQAFVASLHQATDRIDTLIGKVK